MGRSGPERIPLSKHLKALQKAERRFQAERDRRYADIRAGDLRALEVAADKDRRAEELRAENQAYKDEKANNLRSQIESERGTYVTRPELQPILEYVATQQGINNARRLGVGQILALVAVIAAVVSAVAVTVALIIR